MCTKRFSREQKSRKKGGSGFTLVELIVVLVILSILAAVAVPAVTGFIDDGKAKECQTQLEALAADIATAKMSYEVGDETGDTFNIGTYIAGAGELGKCPSGGEYSVDTTDASQTVIACSLHGKAAIPNSGKFSVTVAAPIPEMPSPAPETPTPTPDNTGKDTSPTPTPEHTYKAEIGPGSLTLEEDGATGNLTVTVTDETTGESVSSSKVVTKWYYTGDDGSIKVMPDSSDALRAVVEAAKEGKAQVYCDVTITDDNGREKTVTAGPADVTVNKKKPELHLEVGSLEVEAGKDGNLNARATDGNGEDYSGEVEYRYEVTPQAGDTGEITVDASGNVHGVTPGTCHVTVTVWDKNDPDKRESKTVDVTIKEFSDTQSQPELNVEVPSDLTVREGEDNTELPGGVRVFNEKGQPYGDATITYSSSDEEKATVDPETGKVHGVESGECEITVTVKDNKTGKSVSKNVKVNVEEKESESGLFHPNTMHIWIHDRGAQDLVEEEVFANLLKDLPPGTWSYFSGDGAYISNPNGNDVKLFVNELGAMGPFVLKYETTDGRVDYLTITVGYPVKSLQKPDFSVKNGIKVGDTIVCSTVLNPSETTDVPVNWQFQGTAKVKLSPVPEDKTCAKINVEILSEGTLQMKAYTHCAETDEDVVSDWSDTLTIGNVNNDNQQQTENQSGITGVTLSPNPVNLGINESGTITATIRTKEGSETDLTKVTYSFNVWNQGIVKTDAQQKQSSNTATLTGLEAGSTGIGVEVYYDDQKVAEANCNVKVGGGIAGVTLNPSSMTLREGQSGRLEASAQIWGDVDASKISYKFYNNNSYAMNTVSSGGASAIVTGLHAGQGDTVHVEVYYDNQYEMKVECPVTVIAVPADEVVIDGNCFGAMSWAEFKKNVEKLNGGDFKVNNNRDNPEKEDKIILFYDEEDVNGVKKRTLYVAHGNSADFSTTKTPVSGSDSFKSFLSTSDGKDKLAVVDLEHIIYIDEENLASAPTENGGWPEGTVVRVRKSTGEYEYYVAYDRGNTKTQLDKVGKTKEEKSGWWKLSVLS